MKILLVSRGYISIKQEKCGIFEFDQAKALLDERNEICLFALDFRSFHRIRRYGIFKTIKDGIEVINISFPCSGLPDWLKKYICVHLIRKAYRMYCLNHGLPDIIHSHFVDYSYFVICGLGEENIPIFVTEHSSQVNKDIVPTKLYKKAYITYSKASKVIAVSSALAQKIEMNFGVKSSIIPNIVDTDIFQYNNRIHNRQNFVFVSVANLIPIKRIDLLIKAFSKVIIKYPWTELIVIGDGDERNKISYMIEKFKIKEKVLLTGKISREEINRYYKDADCFVLPSSSETFGVSYIEAMATGLPVIATRCGGPEDFVDESNGILIDVDDENQLYEAMVNMIENINIFDSKKISQTIIDKFSKKTIAKQIEIEYMKVI